MSDIDYEEFYGNRRSHRKERKIASTKDRSKYKKSDRDRAKPLEPPAESSKGRVVKILPDGFLVGKEGQTFLCTLKGSLKQEKTRQKNLVIIGDIVYFEPLSQDQGIILAVAPRYATLSRRDSSSMRHEQLIVANVDQACIVVSVLRPPLKPFLIDRYLIATQKGNISPLIVINKMDLFESEFSPASLVHEKNLLDALINIYSSLDIPLLTVSSLTGLNIDLLAERMAGKTSVFTGQSGVGKSSLINAVTGSTLQTGPIVHKTQRGSHTTASASLLPVQGGGFCIDTPGIKGFGLWDLKLQEVEMYFPEIFACKPHCKFPNCTHIHEPECAVKKAVDEGTIAKLRFDSYLALMQNPIQQDWE